MEQITDNVNRTHITIINQGIDFSVDHLDKKMTVEMIADHWCCGWTWVKGENYRKIPQGLYLCYRYEGHVQGLSQIFNDLFSIWIPHRGYTMGQELCFERYHPYYLDDPTAIVDKNVITAPGNVPAHFSAEVFRAIGVDDRTVDEFLKMLAREHPIWILKVGDTTKAVWSHSDDATIFGGYGGFVEPGWNNVEYRLKAAAQKAAEGKYSYKPIKSLITGDSAYTLQTEQYAFPGNTVIDIRATIICQKEPDGWKIVHRHGKII